MLSKRNVRKYNKMGMETETEFDIKVVKHIEMWDIQELRCLECGMFRRWDV